ncbi:MAG: hypothetical protein WCF84_15150 [Anaerolineae bacterium]
MDDPLAQAILKTLHYADIFDFPLTGAELERYLIGVRATSPEIKATLLELTQCQGRIAAVDRFFTLPSRQPIVAERLRLKQQAQGQAPRAHFYGRLLGYFPFVRMVAITGALAMENARDNDIDLLIVCAPGRLWMVRGAAIALVRLARLRGDHLCPNFLITENRLGVAEENLYNAHEIVQMIPLYGLNLYRRLRRANTWVDRFLPNVDRTDKAYVPESFDAFGLWLKRMGERLLGGRAGEAIEQWEMSRKVRKLSAQIPPNADDVEFSSEACRGFISGHSRRILAEFTRRTQELEPAQNREEMALAR